MNGYPTRNGVTMPLGRWVNLVAHMKDIGKSMMKIKNEDDRSVDARCKPGGDLIIINNNNIIYKFIKRNYSKKSSSALKQRLVVKN